MFVSKDFYRSMSENGKYRYIVVFPCGDVRCTNSLKTLYTDIRSLFRDAVHEKTQYDIFNHDTTIYDTKTEKHIFNYYNLICTLN